MSRSMASLFLRSLKVSQRKFHKATSPLPALQNISQEKHITDPLFLHKRFNQSTAVKCWKCGIERSDQFELFCEKCSVIQNPSQTTNYFKIFGLSEDFNVDKKVLTQKYREMQTVLHPDKFSNRSKEEKEISEHFSSLVNKAYNTLQVPLTRALHLLKLHGEKIDEEYKADDPKFLMEIMELNEQVEDARSPEQLKELDKANKKTLQTICDTIEECFKNGNVRGAKKEIIRMKYYNSVSERINALLREQGVVD